MLSVTQQKQHIIVRFLWDIYFMLLDDKAISIPICN